MLIENFNKHIHQIWFQKKDSSNPPGYIQSEDYRNCQFTYLDFADKNGWEYTLWSEPEVQQLVEESFPEFLDQYNSIDSIIKKVDCARLMILYEYGGLYVDMDSYMKRNLNDFLNLDHIIRDDYPYTDWHIAPKYQITTPYNILVGQEKTVYEYHYNKFGLVIPKLNNAVIFASPKQKVFRDILELGFKRKTNSILNSFGVHTFSLKLYDEMNKFVNKLLDENDYHQPSKILTVPTVYFYECDVDIPDYLEWGGNPIHKNSPLQYIVHKFMGDWDDNSYGHFLENQLPGETLDGPASL